MKSAFLLVFQVRKSIPRPRNFTLKHIGNFTRCDKPHRSKRQFQRFVRQETHCFDISKCGPPGAFRNTCCFGISKFGVREARPNHVCFTSCQRLFVNRQCCFGIFKLRARGSHSKRFFLIGIREGRCDKPHSLKRSFQRFVR